MRLLRAIHYDARGVARLLTNTRDRDRVSLAVCIAYLFALVPVVPLTLMVAVLDVDELDR